MKQENVIAHATSPIILPKSLGDTSKTQATLDELDSRIESIEERMKPKTVLVCRLVASGQCDKVTAYKQIHGAEASAQAAYGLLHRPMAKTLLQLLQRRWRTQSHIQAEDIVVNLMQLAEEARSKGDLKTARACLYDVSKIKGFATESVVNIQNNQIGDGQAVTLNFNFTAKKPFGTLTDAEKQEREIQGQVIRPMVETPLENDQEEIDPHDLL